MNRSLIALAAIIAAAIAAGPTRPYIDPYTCSEEGDKVVDDENMCWYHECTLAENGGLQLTARRCALGSKISYNFVSGMHNPCTHNFDDVIGYACDREEISVDGPPACHPFVCENGGTPTYQADKCWCLCPASWDGNWNCDRPTQDVSDLPPASDICVDGEPMEEWCSSNPCLNNGVCFNQCDTFWCDCPNHEENDYLGKRCEL